MGGQRGDAGLNSWGALPKRAAGAHKKLLREGAGMF